MGKSIYKRVALLGVDGAGAFFEKAYTPNLDRIFAKGAVSHHVLTAEPTISAQCWGSMLLGVKPEIHRLTNGICDETPYDINSPFPSVFRVIHENFPDAELASFCNWNPINYGIIEHNLGATLETGYDYQVTERACEYLKEHDPKFLFMQFDSVDSAGHTYTYGSEKHLAQITEVDGFIQQVYEAYEKRGFLEDTLFMVTADHGGFNKSHGGSTDTEKYVSFMAAGKHIQNGNIIDMEIRDSTAIILHALGLDDKKPSTWTSIVPEGIFPGFAEKVRPVYVIKYENEHRKHAAKPTPGNNIVSVLGKNRVALYLPFDGDNENKVEGIKTDSHGKFYYIDGFYGKGVRMEDGYISLPGFKVDKNSFSVSFWIKTGGVPGDPAILSNMAWANGRNNGFILTLRPLEFSFNVGYEQKDRFQKGVVMPLDFRDGWVHFIFVLDRDKEEVKISTDFGKFQTSKIPDEFAEISFDGGYVVNIGQDGTGEYHHHLSAELDEFVILNDVMTDDDVEVLKKYYEL